MALTRVQNSENPLKHMTIKPKINVYNEKNGVKIFKSDGNRSAKSTKNQYILRNKLTFRITQQRSNRRWVDK